MEQIRNLLQENKVEVWVRFRKSGNIKPLISISKDVGQGYVLNAPIWLAKRFSLRQMQGPVIFDSANFWVQNDNQLSRIIDYIFKRFDVREIRYGKGFFLKNKISMR